MIDLSVNELGLSLSTNTIGEAYLGSNLVYQKLLTLKYEFEPIHENGVLGGTMPDDERVKKNVACYLNDGSGFYEIFEENKTYTYGASIEFINYDEATYIEKYIRLGTMGNNLVWGKYKCYLHQWIDKATGEKYDLNTAYKFAENKTFKTLMESNREWFIEIKILKTDDFTYTLPTTLEVENEEGETITKTVSKYTHEDLGTEFAPGETITMKFPYFNNISEGSMNLNGFNLLVTFID